MLAPSPNPGGRISTYLCMSYPGQHGELSLTRLFHSSPTISFFCMIPRLTLISLYGPFDFEEKYTDVGFVISVVPQAEDLLLYRMSRPSLLQERESYRAESRIGSKQHRPINILITIGGTCLSSHGWASLIGDPSGASGRLDRCSWGRFGSRGQSECPWTA